jgi:hypothetical protein
MTKGDAREWARRQRENVRVAHHLHMPAQVIRAAQWGIPTLLLARKLTARAEAVYDSFGPREDHAP